MVLAIGILHSAKASFWMTRYKILPGEGNESRLLLLHNAATKKNSTSCNTHAVIPNVACAACGMRDIEGSYHLASKMLWLKALFQDKSGYPQEEIRMMLYVSMCFFQIVK